MVAEIGDDAFVLELWAQELAPWLAAAQPMVESLRFETFGTGGPGDDDFGAWQRDHSCPGSFVVAFEAQEAGRPRAPSSSSAWACRKARASDSEHAGGHLRRSEGNRSSARVPCERHLERLPGIDRPGSQLLPVPRWCDPGHHPSAPGYGAIPETEIEFVVDGTSLSFDVAVPGSVRGR